MTNHSRRRPKHVPRLALAFFTAIVIVCAATLITIYATEEDAMGTPITLNTIALPTPALDSKVSLEATLKKRRSKRAFSDAPITLAEASQLLWAAQGVTSPKGYRTAPSAGATFPLETYLVAGNVEGLPPGIYKYSPDGHDLSLVTQGDHRDALSKASLGQVSISQAPATIVFTAVFPRTTVKYDSRGEQYVYIEVGHAAQNVHLQATALSKGSVSIGAFVDVEYSKVLSLPDEEVPLYAIPVGAPAT